MSRPLCREEITAREAAWWSKLGRTTQRALAAIVVRELRAEHPWTELTATQRWGLLDQERTLVAKPWELMSEVERAEIMAARRLVAVAMEAPT